ncbi:hypothetical protein IQ06DRAFT_53008 [Phaeosphaeriaceae sp. SRC1lsM3a]|nr:hypothetical protein IQ06DRAFT_53008 [Stagonospora sp. SRC1lsM3a]
MKSLLRCYSTRIVIRSLRATQKGFIDRLVSSHLLPNTKALPRQTTARQHSSPLLQTSIGTLRNGTTRQPRLLIATLTD